MAEQLAFQQAGGGSIPTPSLQISAKDLAVFPCQLSDVRNFIEKYHYSHDVNGVKVSYCFAIKAFGDLVGGVIYGAMSTTAWKKFADSEKEVLELRRLALLDEVGKNSESRVVGWTLRWLRKNALGVKIVVSYADPTHGHQGTIYRASNFRYLGLSGKDKGFLDPETGRIYHSRSLRTKYKGAYKPFVKKMRDKREKGLLEIIDLPGKHCYVFVLREG
jgi:hypothetical protein